MVRRISFVRMVSTVLAVLMVVPLAISQSKVPSVVGDYWNWREENEPPPHSDSIALFGEKLRSDGMSETEAAAKINQLRRGLIIEEGEFYDEIYEKGPEFTSDPNRLLVEAIANRAPGKALDVGMGQGRNAVFLARQGWTVTGFDPSLVGLKQARVAAAQAGVTIQTVHSGAEYFDFGREAWDLIAIIYPIEKFSVYRVRDALKPGGLIVIEAPHKEASPAPHHYETNELLDIFEGFRVLKYEDTRAVADWGLKETRLVRLIAEKPR